MKAARALLLAALLMTMALPAGAATLCWDYDDPTVDGFRIYSVNSLDFGFIEPQVAVVADPAARQWTLPAGCYLEEQTYLFWMTAYVDAIESPNSMTVEWTVPGILPDDLPPPWGLRMAQ